MPEPTYNTPQWFTVTQASELIQVPKSTIYKDFENGLEHETNDRGIKVIHKEVLEHFYCPFKRAVNYGRARADATMQIQTSIILQQTQMIEMLKAQIESLQNELCTAHEEKSKLLELIFNERKKDAG